MSLPCSAAAPSTSPSPSRHRHLCLSPSIRLCSSRLHRREYDRVALTSLEDARKSFGTDEDLLLISLKKEGEKSSGNMLRT